MGGQAPASQGLLLRDQEVRLWGRAREQGRGAPGRSRPRHVMTSSLAQGVRHSEERGDRTPVGQQAPEG